MPRDFENLDAFRAAAGEELGTSDWLTVTQEQINTFADATGDHQWIHVDPERAAAGPFGRTIAHGYLTVALIPMLVDEIYRVEGLRMGINYGSDKVRLPSPVPVGSRVRMTATIATVDDVKGGVQLTTSGVIEIEGQERPALVVDFLARFLR